MGTPCVTARDVVQSWRRFLHMDVLALDFDATAVLLTLLDPQSRFGGKPLKLQVVCPQNGTAVLKGLNVDILGGLYGWWKSPVRDVTPPALPSS